VSEALRERKEKAAVVQEKLPGYCVGMAAGEPEAVCGYAGTRIGMGSLKKTKSVDLCDTGKKEGKNDAKERNMNTNLKKGRSSGE